MAAPGFQTPNLTQYTNLRYISPHSDGTTIRGDYIHDGHGDQASHVLLEESLQRKNVVVSTVFSEEIVSTWGSMFVP